MPDYQFTFIVRGISPQKAGAIGQRIQQRLTDDAVDVAAVNTARTTATYRIVSVDTQTKQVFDETVEASDEQAARDLVQTATRVVATVDGGTA